MHHALNVGLLSPAMDGSGAWKQHGGGLGDHVSRHPASSIQAETEVQLEKHQPNNPSPALLSKSEEVKLPRDESLISNHNKWADCWERKSENNH